MAETLTYENNQEVTTIDNLNAEEQESLKVGEAMEEAQDSLLAGKYKDAQELEQPTDEVQENTEDTEDKNETEENPSDFSFLDTLYTEATSGNEYNKETIEKLSQMSTEQVADMHLRWVQDAATKYIPKPPDFTQQDVQELKGVVGGDQNYSNMIEWANQNLSPKEIEMFDSVMERGDSASAFFAVKSLAYRYNDTIGKDGQMITGTAPKSDGSVFRSQAEVVKAMRDSRYDRDPAYRQDIQDKLSRSNINF
jgi:alpha-L-fucosidase